MGIKVGEAAVGAPGHAHAVPQPGGAQQLVDHVAAAVQGVARVLVQVGRLAYIIDLDGSRIDVDAARDVAA